VTISSHIMNVPINELIADPKNARLHSEAQIAQIAKSIEQFLYLGTVIVQPTGQIIGGHATVEALKRIYPPDKKVDVRVVEGLTKGQYAALALALNKLPEASTWNDGILRELFGELDEDGIDLSALGFSLKEIDKLTSPADDLDVKEIDTSDVHDEFWISVRGPLADQAHALKALQEALKPFKDVTVDQGTIAI